MAACWNADWNRYLFILSGDIARTLDRVLPQAACSASVDLNRRLKDDRPVPKPRAVLHRAHPGGQRHEPVFAGSFCVHRSVIKLLFRPVMPAARTPPGAPTQTARGRGI